MWWFWVCFTIGVIVGAIVYFLPLSNKTPTVHYVEEEPPAEEDESSTP